MRVITDLKLDQKSRILSLTLDGGRVIDLSCEYLRVFSPSAEVRGHGPGQEVLQTGKEMVNIAAIEPVGNYAARLVFSDGHDTGIYAWKFLLELAENKDANWKDYLASLDEAGIKRKE
ncbi:MAG: hypothetical protein A6F71_08320 [Cycloclasticus sp. symbiont of Poecilosclerida sp. M]|nr:MAG: hypothetical protein A6F71_08320 [Cycloclasticus sp. symbiont of Poecilosclerida sp. M]